MALTKAQEKEKQKHIRYWTRRETEQKKHNITEEAEYSKELQKIYDNMLDNVQKEIDSFYMKYAKKEGLTLAEAKKAISQHDVKAFERKAARYVKEKNFSKEANEELRLYNATMRINRLEMLKANIGLEMIAGADEQQKFMEKILQGRTMEELERQAGILGKTIKNNAQTANAIVNASFHNAKFSDRIWMHQDLLKNDLHKLLQSGLIAGKNPRVLAKEIKQRFEVKTSDAERLMRTELARVQTEAQKQSFERNGFTQYTFLALGDACPICADINGNHYKVADMMPGLNAPPLHPFCRCSTAAYEDDKEYEEWLDFLANGGTTAEYEASKKAKAVVERNKFKPAKDIKEAEEYIKQFVDDKGFGALGVSYKGIDIEVANTINRTFANVFEVFNVEKFGGIIAPAGNTKLGKMIEGATAGYSPVRKSFLLNRKTLKNMKTAQKALEGEVGSMKNLLEHPERYDFTKLSKRVLNVVERAKVSGRATVPTSVEDILHHEIGHMLEKQVYKNPAWENAQANMNKYANKISGYAGESKGEYIAESFAAYMKGENVVDPVLVEIFENLKR